NFSTDGSLRSPQRNAAAGEVIHDNRGSLVKAFTMNLGCCFITRAEMRGIVESLKLAWSLGIRRIRVQSDFVSNPFKQLLVGPPAGDPCYAVSEAL
ncbi:hypothetical protein LINGRAHAP2_LOCUS23499, partial [Linum grandiflorum]